MLSILELICSLPCDVVGSSLFEMVGLRGVVFLDSAAMVRSVRPVLSTCCSHFESEIPQVESLSNTLRRTIFWARYGSQRPIGLLWILSRNIRVTSVLISSEDVELLPFLEQNLHLISSLKLNSQTGQSGYLGICTKRNIAAKLRELTVQRSVYLYALVDHRCPLTNLRFIRFYGELSTEQWHTELVRNNPNLEEYRNEDSVTMRSTALVDTLIHSSYLTSVTIATSP